MNHAVDAITRRWGFRRAYANLGGWLISYYDAVLRKFKRVPLPGRHRIFAVHLKSCPRPLYVRLGHADGFILEEVFLRKCYDALFEAELGEVRTIVDLGANAGVTVRLWNLRFPEAKIIAVEPDTGNCGICRKNVDACGDGVYLVQACVGARPREAYLNMGNSECTFQMVDAKPDQSQSVQVRTIPQILDECRVADREIDLLKCDIEGAERELFSECAEWIQRVRTIVIEIHAPYTVDAMGEDLRRAGAAFEVVSRNGTVYVFRRRLSAAQARA